MKLTVVHLSESNYGIHCLVVYPDLETLREFYSQYIQNQIDDKDEVVQIALFYENEDSVRHTLSQGQSAINIDKVEDKEKTLIIVDSLTNYFSDEDIKLDWETKRESVRRAKSVGKKEFLFWVILVHLLSKNEYKISSTMGGHCPL